MEYGVDRPLALIKFSCISSVPPFVLTTNYYLGSLTAVFITIVGSQPDFALRRGLNGHLGDHADFLPMKMNLLIYLSFSTPSHA
jgi:hypothetical protein